MYSVSCASSISLTLSSSAFLPNFTLCIYDHLQLLTGSPRFAMGFYSWRICREKISDLNGAHYVMQVNGWKKLTFQAPLNTDISSIIKGKVKCTLVQALSLCTGRTAHRGSRGITLLFLDHGTRSGWGFSVTPRPLFTPGKDPVSIVQEAGWALGPVWTGVENLAPRGSIPGPFKLA